MTWWITDTSIGQRLKFVRRFRRLTQKELGLLMGYSEKTADVRIAQYEKNARTPNEETTAKFAEVLKVSPAVFSPTICASREDLLQSMYWLFLMKGGGDIYDCETEYALLKQDEKEAHHVATALEIYVKGSLKLFNNRTNVDIQNRLVCFDIKELGNQLKKIGMLIVQDQVWGRVTANRSAGKSTRYYIDEFHLLLKEEQTATYSVEIWKRFRKWGGLPTGITQNVKDLLRSPEIANILENSDFIYMLNQASDDRSILAQRLNISPHQLSYVTNSGEGEGLLFYGNVILPFIDRFPTDLELYRIMTTKLNEVAQEKEA